MGKSGDGFGGDVELNFVGVTMEVKVVATDDVTERKEAEDEKEETKHQTLRDAVGQGGGGGGVVIDPDELLSVGDIGSEPCEGGASDVEGGFGTGEKDGVVDGVKGCRRVEEDEDVGMSRIRGVEEIISKF